MKGLMANFTAGLLFLHALLGCCWLHWHQCDTCPAELCQLAAYDGFCPHHQAAGPQSDNADDPCQCRLECPGDCVYLPPERAQLHTSALTNFVALCSRSTTLDDNRVARAAYSTDGRGDPFAPLRLHLLHQILLI
jgi:hypothetical protein